LGIGPEQLEEKGIRIAKFGMVFPLERHFAAEFAKGLPTILQFDSSNGPIRFTLANKGVGPAVIKHVIVKVDDQPVKNWVEVLDKILGPGYHPGEESDMSSRVFSAGESMNVFTPHDDAQNPIPFDKSNPLWAKLDAGRSRVTVEICYCSTLGECWTLRGGGTAPSTTTRLVTARVRQRLRFSSR
jgi:hypothetical protein